MNDQEPTGTASGAAPPAKLTGRALEIWTERVPVFIGMATMFEADRADVAMACRQQALAEQYAAEAEASPMVVTPTNGAIANPAISASLKCDKAARDVWFRMGAMAAERTRIKTGAPREPDNPLEKILARQRQARKRQASG